MRIGLDVGSTTIKCVVLNDEDQIVYESYERFPIMREPSADY